MLNHRFTWSGLALTACLFAACSPRLLHPKLFEGREEHEEKEAVTLDSKNAPNDHFVWQRIWPDTAFNWPAWRRTIAQARLEAETLPTNERSADPCSAPVGPPTAWTLQGPSNIPGRVNTIAVKPNDENTLLAGFAGGGIFKSVNGGQTWKPVFDNFPELSIGHIAFDPSQPNVVYAGTGDANLPIILYNGEGVYKSTDAGETWQYWGLSEVGVISKIVVHPTEPLIIWVASMGNPYTRDNERGVYRTINGGQTWNKVLSISNQAGCSSLEVSKANPEIVYASFWDRIRNNSESVIWGNHAQVWKSVNGGDTWAQVGGGLPTGPNGRTGLAVSQQDPNKLYALFVDTLSNPGGLYRSTNGGATWTALNITTLGSSYGGFGWYFGKLSLNPSNDDDLFFHGVQMYRRAANGTWQTGATGHPDSHVLAWCPSGRRYWGNDGGVYRNEPNTQIWTRSKNLPATQVYRTSYNPNDPNDYWAGAQDNGIFNGNASSINNWTSVYAADGFRSAFNPGNQLQLWVETQLGTVHYSNDLGNSWTSTGTSFDLLDDRVNWDAPFFRSDLLQDSFFAATYRVLGSNNGLDFTPISGDLTDGPGSEPQFHTVSWLCESPLQAGKLLAGTTDANVWRSTPNGTWTNISVGLPDRYVTSVVGSPTNVNRIFVTHSGFRDDEYIPHVHRSDDNGSTWVDVSGNLPQVPVNQIFVMPDCADSVLVVATDAGAYFSRSSGATWTRLGKGIPAVPVFDFALNIQRRELVAATHGRGVWTFPLDSLLVQPGLLAPVANLAPFFHTQEGEAVSDVVSPPFGTGVISNSQGFMALPTLPACDSVVVKPFRDDDPTNGVTTFDLVLINRHILNLEGLASPYRIIAADANHSNTITTFDIVTLRRLILGIDSTLANNTSWRFVPENFNFPQPENPFASPFPELLRFLPAAPPLLSFIGIKIGDVNFTATPNATAPADERTLGEWPVWTTDREVRAGEVFELPLSADIAGVASAQFTCSFDPAQLEWLDAQADAARWPLDEHANLTQARRGVLSFAWENANELFNNDLNTSNAATRFVTLRWRAKTGGRLSDLLRIDSRLTTALAYRADGTPLQPVLRCQAPATANQLVASPNPFGAGGCWLQLPAFESEGHLQVFDAQGRLCATTTVTGGGWWVLRPEVAEVPGVYQIELRAGTQVWRVRVVRV